MQGNALIITSNSTLNSLTMTLTGVTAPGTFPLTLTGGVRMIQVMGASLNPQNTDCCWGGTAASTGTITVTSVTATRVAGTFSATLAPLPGSHATGTLVVSNGSFDVGLPQP